jgi:hypothetical protein
MKCNPYEDESCISFKCTEESCQEDDCDVFEDESCVTCDPNEADAVCIPEEGARGTWVTTHYYIPSPPIFFRPAVVTYPPVVVTYPPIAVTVRPCYPTFWNSYCNSWGK